MWCALGHWFLEYGLAICPLRQKFEIGWLSEHLLALLLAKDIPVTFFHLKTY